MVSTEELHRELRVLVGRSQRYGLTRRDLHRLADICAALAAGHGDDPSTGSRPEPVGGDPDEILLPPGGPVPLEEADRAGPPEGFARLRPTGGGGGVVGMAREHFRLSRKALEGKPLTTEELGRLQDLRKILRQLLTDGPGAALLVSEQPALTPIASPIAGAIESTEEQGQEDPGGPDQAGGDEPEG